MSTLIYSMSVSLDGRITAGDSDIDWGAPDEELHRFHNEQVRELSLHILGRRLYEVMAYWETPEGRDPSAPDYHREFAGIWNALPKIVFSKTLETVEGNTRLSRGDAVDEVRALKEESQGNIGVGGAALASTLTAHALIDEYRLFVIPVVVGAGRPFFGGDTRMDLELVETRTFGSRAVYLRYRRT